MLNDMLRVVLCGMPCMLAHVLAHVLRPVLFNAAMLSSVHGMGPHAPAHALRH